jgi:hypothetical protein
MATVVGRRAEPAAAGEARRAVWPSLSWSWWLVALTGLYFVAGKLGLSLAFVHASATAVCHRLGSRSQPSCSMGRRCGRRSSSGRFESVKRVVRRALLAQ